MKCILKAVVLLSLFTVSALSADKSIDKHTKEEASGKYYLVFCARGGSPTGHAFVVWGKEDNAEQLSSVEGFGFYPKNDGDKGVLGDVPGAIIDEATKQSLSKITDRLIVRVDKATYDGAAVARDSWRTSDFNLFSANCINFTMDVAKKAKLNVPSKSSITKPSDYIKELVEQN